MIVGWRVAGHMRSPMVLDAIEMARWNRGPPRGTEGIRSGAARTVPRQGRGVSFA
ncbi:hypothetical protein DSM104329_00920 [Capillimicrobium parvum]|uniref:Uncharacterized protein n=1 Tax=Capillimicrobium parvum TaxID=2884022 RepID=A0A9E7BZJ6_9ACTN|nr:hypothetical protein DSM104329_00920 [Capillimicrobium parvum]